MTTTYHLKSMTGFGISEVQDEKLSLTIQVKSVNGRFLETRIKLPREYQVLEIDLKKAVAEFFARGTIDVYVNRAQGEQTATAAVKVNTELARAWVQSYQELGKELHLSAEPNLDMVARVPGVLQVEEASEIAEWEKSLVLKALKAAAASCAEERSREGKAQAGILNALLDELEEFVNVIQKHRTSLNEKLHKKLKERLESVAGEIAIDPQRLAQEVLFAVEHADIQEEVERALTHIKAYRKLLSAKESVGKKLEFYTQELHREVNTMGSKTNDLALTDKIIHAKAVVERLREQVQNVE